MNAITKAPDRQRAIFWFVLLCTLVDRIFLIWKFGIAHTGTDDVIFWDVARDMANGLFREPFLYGQNYNPAIESLLAVPLLWATVPMNVAMPIATSLLALLPFLAFAFWQLRERNIAQATLFAAMPLLLPVEWGMMTVITRGFVSGLAVLALLPWLYRKDPSATRTMLIGAVMYAALFANPNALLFIAPFALWYITRSDMYRTDMYRTKSFFARTLQLAAGALPVLVLHVLAVRFYAAEPLRVVHRVDDWRMTFHPGELIPEALMQLDKHFAWLMPVWTSGGPWILAMLLGTVVWLLVSGKRIEALAISLIFSIILVSFAFPKVHDGFENVFFPYSRMFLALPLVLAWALCLLPWHPQATRWTPRVLVALVPVLLFLKMQGIPDVIDRQMGQQDLLPVRETAMAPLREEIAHLQSIAQDHSVDLVLCLDADGKYRSQLVTYAGRILAPDFPPTLYAGVDRRYWRRLEEQGIQRSTILVIGGEYETWEVLRDEHPGVVLVGDPAERTHVLKENQLSIEDVLALFGRSLHHPVQVTPRSRSATHHPPDPPPLSTSGNDH